ncbi:MAG: methyltransferase [Leptospiraceae bacterium]|nr:methyltransferase [Leptospiraceae bacterium]MCP5512087.1 methyltransferase [Leptospiraceae bacterium]
MKDEVTDKLWKISSGLKFSSDYLIPIERGKPISPANLGSGFQKFYLEIGSGWGEVAIELAEKAPETLFVLMEKKIDRLIHTETNLKARKLQNLRFLCVNFNWFFTELFQPESFDEILMNFPDPWPKKKHTKHRTFNEDFPKTLLYLLKPGGKFNFATDHNGYGRQVIRILRNSYSDEIKNFQYKSKRENFPISFFEKENVSSSHRFTYIEFEKNS